MLNVTGNPNVDQRLASLYQMFGNRKIRQGQRLGHLHAYQMFLMTEFYGSGHSAETIKYRDLLLEVIADEEARILKFELCTATRRAIFSEGDDLYSFLAKAGLVYYYDPTSRITPT